MCQSVQQLVPTVFKQPLDEKADEAKDLTERDKHLNHIYQFFPLHSFRR